VLGADLLRGHQAFVRMGRRHSYIDDRGVRLRELNMAEQ
jgi:hypothetical protein